MYIILLLSLSLHVSKRNIRKEGLESSGSILTFEIASIEMALKTRSMTGIIWMEQCSDRSLPLPPVEIRRYLAIARPGVGFDAVVNRVEAWFSRQ